MFRLIVVDRALWVGDVPQALESLLEVTDPVRIWCQPGPQRARPRLVRGELRDRRRLVTDKPVEDDEVEDRRLQIVGDELLIQHADLDPGVALHPGDALEALVLGQGLGLEHEDTADADLPGDRLPLVFEIADTQVARPETAVEAEYP